VTRGADLAPETCKRPAAACIRSLLIRKIFRTGARARWLANGEVQLVAEASAGTTSEA
jgi:hypothetical protein